MTIPERIQIKAKEKGLSLKALEKEIGLGNGTIRRWAENSPQCDKLSLVANYLHISLDWIIFGKESENLSEREKEIIKAYRNATEGRQEAIRALLNIPESPGKSSTCKTGKEAI